jgi:exopolysaccharide biosynthesis polyprenyl glycosylphosphotransferase
MYTRTQPDEHGIAMDLPLGTDLSSASLSAAIGRRPPLAAIFVAFDAAALLLASLLWSGFDEPLPMLAFTSTALVLMALSGHERPRISPRVSDDLAALVAVLAVSAMLVAPLADDTLRGFLRVFPVTVVLFVAFRAVACKVIRTARARGYVVDRVIIVGAGEQGSQLASILLGHPEYGLQPVGFVDSFENDHGLPLPVLGRIEELGDLISRYGVRRLIIAFGGTREPEMIRTLRALDPLPVEIHVVPRFFEFGGISAGGHVDDIWGMPIVQLRRSALRSLAWRGKRALDVIASSLLIVISSPIMLACVIGVRLSGRGPILFRQKRVGQRGELFELLKFRSMRQNDLSDTQWSASGGDLLTPFGKFMRKTGIDELPQLFNVLAGSMSLVGPRPERPYFADRFSVDVRGYADRHRVPVGMTGWAQVHGLRGDSSISQRAHFDNQYIEHWSLWRDVVILARTVGTVVKGEGR